MSLAAAIRLKLPVRESRGDLGTTLLNDMVVLGYAGKGVLGALPHQPSQDELYAYRVFHTEGVYHHIYNVMTTAAVLLGRAAEPTRPVTPRTQPTHFAFRRIPAAETDAAKLRHAADYERGLTTRFGPWNRSANDAREAVTILDLASHELLDVAPAEFDACRRLVRDAACYDLVVSHPFLENADAALATLIETIPIDTPG